MIFDDNSKINLSYLHKNLSCGCSLELPRRGDSNEHPQLRFLWRNKQNYHLIVIKYHQIRTLFPLLILDADLRCGGIILEQLSWVTSPDRDNDGVYDTNLNCKWLIMAANKTFTIALGFTPEFGIEESPGGDCTYDSLTVNYKCVTCMLFICLSLINCLLGSWMELNGQICRLYNWHIH